MHGSMQVEGLDSSPEGEMIKQIRELIGDRALAVSYDLHGNLSQPMLEPDVVVAFHTNPHRDLFGTGMRAGQLLIKTLRDKHQPVHAWRKLPMVLGGGMSIDFLAPMRTVFNHIHEMERRPGVLSANLFMVHPYSKAEDLGWAVHVTTDGDEALANRCAEELADLAWAQRKVPLPEMYDVAGALDQVRDNRVWRKLGAVSLVDVDDIVGTGAPGGNTHLIKELVNDDRGLISYVPLHDPAASATLWALPEGEAVSIALSGTPGYEQPEVALEARLVQKQETDFGKTIRLDVAGGELHIAVTERPPYTCSPNFWNQLGLPARKADLIVQKAFFHYRMFYAASSFRHIGFVSDGASSLQRVIDRKYKVPTWPGKQPEDWRRYDPILRGLVAADAEAQHTSPA
jgi:microcystin degradation protein MlrC